MFNFKFINLFYVLLLSTSLFAQSNSNLNLGNIAYKNGEFGKAMLYWKRAEMEAGIFSRVNILNRIDLLKQITLNGSFGLFGQDKTYKRHFKKLKFVKDYFVSIVRTLPYWIIKLLFLFLWIVVFFYIRKLFRSKQKLVILLLFFITCLLGLIFVLRHKLDFKNYGVVISKQVEVFSGLGSGYPVISILPIASVVRIENKANGCYKIRNQRTVGFVDQKCVEKIVN